VLTHYLHKVVLWSLNLTIDVVTELDKAQRSKHAALIPLACRHTHYKNTAIMLCNRKLEISAWRQVL